MNILNRYTLKTLRKNKSRTIVTIIGIILSTAMFSAVTIFASSLLNNVTEMTIYECGGFHGYGEGVVSSSLKKLRDDKALKDITTLADLGYMELTNCRNADKPYLHVEAMEKDGDRLLPVHLKEGRLPETSGELILPEHLKTNGGIRYQIGDVIEGQLNDRTLEAGSLLSITDAYNKGDERLAAKDVRSYQVVGFYERSGMEPYQSPGYLALTLYNEATDAERLFTAYFEMKEPNNIYSFLLDYKEEFTLGKSVNNDLLRCLGESNETGFNKVLFGLCAVFIGIIMLASISLIFNAFSISLGERTQQFGLISSIGATRHQLRRSVIFEAFSLCLVGIPLGLLAGVGGMGLTMHFLKDSFSRLLNNGSNNTMTLSMYVAPWCLLIAAAIALVTVLISALIPAQKATRITAIEAIRQTGDIKIKAKKVKTSRLTYKLFGLEGMIASKNFKRNRKKYRATVISLFITIVLFVSASSFCAYLQDSVNNILTTYDMDVCFSMPNEGDNLPDTMEVYEKMSQSPHVTKASYLYTNALRVEVPSNQLSERYTKYMEKNNTGDLQYDKSTNTYLFSTPVIFIEDDVYRDYLNEQGLTADEYMNEKNPKALVYNNIFVWSDGKYYKSKFYNSDAKTADVLLTKPLEGYDYCSVEVVNARKGNTERKVTYSTNNSEETKEIPFEDAFVNNSFVLGKRVTEMPLGVPSNTHMPTPVYLFPESSMTSVLREYTEGNYCTFNYLSDNHKKLTEELSKIAEDYSLSTSNLLDYREQGESTKSIMLIINIFSYGFILLISLISVANVFNTISTNIILRKREFAMLRTVGMTNQGFNKMMNYECLLYGTKALLFGLPVSILFTYFFIYRTVTSGIETAFYIPINSIIIAVASVFIVVFATMLYAMKRIKKENTIEALRSDNI